jgi:hypothetical protein
VRLLRTLVKGDQMAPIDLPIGSLFGVPALAGWPRVIRTGRLKAELQTSSADPTTWSGTP